MHIYWSLIYCSKKKIWDNKNIYTRATVNSLDPFFHVKRQLLWICLLSFTRYVNIMYTWLWSFEKWYFTNMGFLYIFCFHCFGNIAPKLFNLEITCYQNDRRPLFFRNTINHSKIRLKTMKRHFINLTRQVFIRSMWSSNSTIAVAHVVSYNALTRYLDVELKL